MTAWPGRSEPSIVSLGGRSFTSVGFRRQILVTVASSPLNSISQNLSNSSSSPASPGNSALACATEVSVSDDWAARQFHMLAASI